MGNSDKLSDLLNEYVIRGFGSMNKNDFEVFIFYRLLNDKKYNLSQDSDYEISRKLKVPISKVKRLRYEATLKYCDELDATNKAMFINAIRNIKIRKDKKSISFIIENVSVRKYLENQLKKDGRFSDSSFNSEIVVLAFDDFKFLLSENLSEKDKSNLLKKCRAQNIGDIVDKLITKLLDNLTDKSIESVINLTPNLIGYVINVVTS